MGLLKFNGNKKLKIIFILFSFISISCDDLLVRYNYENYKCPNNNANINKISVLKVKIGSKVNIFIRGVSYDLIITEINKEKIILKNFEPNITILIKRNSGEISGVINRNVFSFNCKKDIFRI